MEEQEKIIVSSVDLSIRKSKISGLLDLQGIHLFNFLRKRYDYAKCMFSKTKKEDYATAMETLKYKMDTLEYGNKNICMGFN